MPASPTSPSPTSPRPVAEIAAELGILPDEIEPFGRLKAKIQLSVLDRLADRPKGKLVLVTAVTPTRAGEGKTTVSIGLAQGLCRIGVRCVAALRQPSLGPVFGQKGGATGGGRSQVVPMEDINLHFTGDLHAITAANNLLAAVVDNHLHWGNALDLEARAITWKRCQDMNDRSLRDIVVGLGGPTEGVPRQTGFEITAASEVMAILALADSLPDLRERLERVVVGRNGSGAPVTAGQLKAAGAMAILLKDALLPNLAQTLEGTPAIIHCGPFGNIAHGCSSVLGTRMALALGEVCVTEAGFGADLGAEKYFDIKMRESGLAPDLAVLVATVRALKLHGGIDPERLETEDLAAVERGFVNLARHAENLRKFGLQPVVGINRFAADTEAELELVASLCRGIGLKCAVADVFGQGGAGTEELAALVRDSLREPSECRVLYPDDLPIPAKIETIARELYRASDVDYLTAARKSLKYLEEHGFGRLPVCIAKTQYSFSDNAALVGAPEGHVLTVRDVKLSAGAGFVVVYCGAMQTMPGLPRIPRAERMELHDDGTITGLR